MFRKISFIICFLLIVTTTLVACSKNDRELKPRVEFSGKLSEFKEAKFIKDFSMYISDSAQENLDLFIPEYDMFSNNIILNESSYDVKSFNFFVKTSNQNKYSELRYVSKQPIAILGEPIDIKSKPNTIDLKKYIDIVSRINYEKIIKISQKSQNSIAITPSKDFILTSDLISISKECKSFYYDTINGVQEFSDKNSLNKEKKYLKININDATFEDKVNTLDSQSMIQGQRFAEVYIEM